MMLCSSAFVFGAETGVSDKVTVIIDGQEMEYDVQPMIENRRTLVPLRAVSEAFDVRLLYYEKGKIICCYFHFIQ